MNHPILSIILGIFCIAEVLWLCFEQEDKRSVVWVLNRFFNTAVFGYAAYLLW